MKEYDADGSWVERGQYFRIGVEGRWREVRQLWGHFSSKSDSSRWNIENSGKEGLGK